MNGEFRIGPWAVVPSLNSVSCEGTTVRLEPKVMQVLLCLAQHAGETLSKEAIFQAVWPDTFVTDDVLKHAISELRRVFEDDAHEPRIIQTIPKRGYRLVAPVDALNGNKDYTSQAVRSPVASSAAGSFFRTHWIWGLAVAGTIALSLVVVNWGRLPTRLTGTSGIPPIHSLAVLPLQNLSADPAQEYFSDGLTDALITDLAQFGSLKVISRTSSMQYKQTKKSLPEIARELGVDGIVEGTVQRDGDRVRITAQLIHGPSDKHLWASSYERDLRDVFALERDVTSDIAREVQARVTTLKPPQIGQAGPVNPRVLDAYLEGNYHLHGYGRGAGDEEKKRASDLFQQVIDADPAFAPGYVGMAMAHLDRLQSSSEDLATTKRAAEKAVQLDPTSSDVWLVFGEMKEETFLDWPGAEQDYRHAVALNPNNASAHRVLGEFLGEIGSLDEGLKECQIAQQLDPNEDHLSRILYLRREYDRGIATAQMMLRSHPDDGYLHLMLYADYTKKGVREEAIEQLQQGLKLFGYQEPAINIGRAYGRSGYTGAMHQWATELEHLHDTNQAFLPGNLAITYAALGDKNHAFYWLDQAYQHRDIVGTDIPLAFLIRDPMADPLRSDRRFVDLARRIGLPP